MPEINQIKGKIILKGQLKNLSPIHIGSGRDERSDMDIMRAADGKPFVPATSFIGALRHTILKNCFGGKEDQNFKTCWGYTEKNNEQQSAISCSHLTILDNEFEIVCRDGIRIDSKTGLVCNQGKFDYELLERGAHFELNMEFTYNDATESYIKQTARTIYELLSNGHLSIGAKTTAGFGVIALVKENTNFYLFDFDNSKTNVYRWLTRKFVSDNIRSPTDLANPFPFKRRCFAITAKLRLKNSLIIRSYGKEAEFSDAVQLKSLEQWVIPGTSLKGAIRARAERIVRTLELKNVNEILFGLFGFVEEDWGKIDYEPPEQQKAKKGKLRIYEIYLDENDFPTELQTRIKIDRFTGGVIEGSLFDTMPIFAPESGKYLTLRMEIDDYDDHEAGLILLILKDLWSGDLPVGGEKNIGRGIFQGVQAKVEWGDKTITIGSDIDQLTPEEKETLQNFVKALIEETTL